MGNPSPFHVLSLCSGMGGLDLGLRLAVPGARTICYVENEAYCCEILAARMQDQCLDAAPVWSDLRTFDGSPWRGLVSAIIGGYPCQPYSITGRRQGTDDPRHLWPHVARVVREVDPEWCFFENVSNHLNIGFPEVARELQEMGYRVAAGLFSAEEVSAPHKRERLFVLAHSHEQHGDHRRSGASPICGQWRQETKLREGQSKFVDDTQLSGRGSLGSRSHGGGEGTDINRKKDRGIGEPSEILADTQSEPERKSEYTICAPPWEVSRTYVGWRGRGMAHANGEQLEVGTGERRDDGEKQPSTTRVCGERLFPPRPNDFDGWSEYLETDPTLEPAIRRSSDGLASRMERLRAGGNGVVPLVAAYAFRSLFVDLDE